MTLSKRFGIFLMAGIIGLCALELGERLSIPGVHGLISSAEAIVGRPLTPVSGQKGEQLGNVRLGLTMALSMSRNRSIKFYGSNGVYSRIAADYWAAGVAWQFRLGGGL